jgi:hypothetical protein
MPAAIYAALGAGTGAATSPGAADLGRSPFCY